MIVFVFFVVLILSHLGFFATESVQKILNLNCAKEGEELYGSGGFWGENDNRPKRCCSGYTEINEALINQLKYDTEATAKGDEDFIKRHGRIAMPISGSRSFCTKNPEKWYKEWGLTDEEINKLINQ